MCDDVNERRVPFHTLRQCVSERGFSACFPIQRRRHHHPQRQDATSTSNNGNILSTKSHRWDVHLQKNTQKCRDLLMCLRPPHPKLSQFISFPPTPCHRIEATRAGSIRWRRELDKKKNKKIHLFHLAATVIEDKAETENQWLLISSCDNQ